MPILVKIDQEMRPWEFSQTDRHTDTLTDANRFYNLSHAIEQIERYFWITWQLQYDLCESVSNCLRKSVDQRFLWAFLILRYSWIQRRQVNCSRRLHFITVEMWMMLINILLHLFVTKHIQEQLFCLSCTVKLMLMMHILQLKLATLILILSLFCL